MPSISYHHAAPEENESDGDTRVLLALLIVNATFAAATVFWWTVLSVFVAEPIEWATWQGISSRPDLTDYPFVLLWLLPTAGVVAAWMAWRANNVRLACRMAMFPIVLLGLIIAWYYLTPPDWH
jgi:hypothetical protein